MSTRHCLDPIDNYMQMPKTKPRKILLKGQQKKPEFWMKLKALYIKIWFFKINFYPFLQV